MKQTELEQFLDTGWMEGADLFFRGKIYRTEWCVDGNGRGSTTVFSWHAKKFPAKNTTTNLPMRKSNDGYAFMKMPNRPKTERASLFCVHQSSKEERFGMSLTKLSGSITHKSLTFLACD